MASKRIDTKLIHAGQPRIAGAVEMPIFQSAMFEYVSGMSYHDLGYIRLNNTPNHRALHAKLAELEGSEDALIAASGMAAISTTLLTVLSAGDHLLAQSTLYGGTQDLLTHEFPKLGIAVDLIDADDASSWHTKLRPNTKAIYVEAMTNPLLNVADLEGVVAFARANKLISLIDNTFATPINFRPIELGFDLSLHSCTKYLNGHSDIVAGACVGKAEMVERVRRKLNHFGGSLDPHAVFLLHRGVKTLALRVRYQYESALSLAQVFESQPRVLKGNYPGLASHPHYRLPRELFSGFGGMPSLQVKGNVDDAQRLSNRTNSPPS